MVEVVAQALGTALHAVSLVSALTTYPVASAVTRLTWPPPNIARRSSYASDCKLMDRTYDVAQDDTDAQGSHIRQSGLTFLDFNMICGRSFRGITLNT